MSLTVQTGLRELTGQLAANGIADPAREARIVLADVIGQEPGRLTLMANDPLTAQTMQQAKDLAARRGMGEPMSHLLGYREFFGRRFAVDARVLDPRPETETLVAAALSEPFDRVLDLGTGSGAIVASLLAERPDATAVATDISDRALAVAADNARNLGVSDRLDVLRADWFDGVMGQFDLIVSNPPYIALDEMNGLQRELAFEPRGALTDEADGLTAYRRIVAGLGPFLGPGGRVLVEIGPTQGPIVCGLFASIGLQGIKILHDLDGRDRVVQGYRA